MSRPRPPSPDCIKDIKERVELLINMFKTLKVNDAKGAMINVEEVSALTGLSKSTVQRYGRLEYFTTVKTGARTVFPLYEICKYVQDHYRPARKYASTSQLNTKRRGRPCSLRKGERAR